MPRPRRALPEVSGQALPLRPVPRRAECPCGGFHDLLPPVVITEQRCPNADCRLDGLGPLLYQLRLDVERYGRCPVCDLVYWHNGRGLEPVSREGMDNLRRVLIIK